MKTYLTPEKISYQLSNLRQLTFEITDACNLRCKYCGYGEFYEDYDKRENKELSEVSAITILNYLMPYWSSSQNVSSDRNVYISFYGGEPLLNMKFIKKIVSYLEEHPSPHRHFTFSMTTNAILLDKYMDYLADKKFNLLISLDGNEEHTSYRVNPAGKNAFEQICKNVNLLKDKYPTYFEEQVNFNAVLHNRNSVEGIYRFFKETYNKIPSIGELNDMGIRVDKAEEFWQTYKSQEESLQQSEHYQELEKDMFIQAPTYQTVCTFIHQYSDFVFRDYNELLYGKAENSAWITGTCMPFNKKMFVTVNGKILSCERIGHQFALGQVTEAGVELDLESISQRYNAYLAKLEKQCKACYRKKSCVQCIFNLENLENKPICNGCMDKNAFEQYVAYNMNFLANRPEDYYRIMEEVIVE